MRPSKGKRESSTEVLDVDVIGILRRGVSKGNHHPHLRIPLLCGF